MPPFPVPGIVTVPGLVGCRDCLWLPATRSTTQPSASMSLMRSRYFMRGSGLSLAERPLPPEHVVVMLGEAVGLVADVLQEPQRERPPAQNDRLGLPGDEDLFLALGQRDQGRGGTSHRLECLERRVELALAA